jgi:hypothetical protein
MNTQEEAPNKPANKSTFITVLAWIIIVLTGFATCISIMQNILIHTVFPLGEMQAAMANDRQSNNFPALAIFMLSQMQWIMGVFLAISIAAFISGIGLLKRRNWARILIIIFLGMGIIWNIVGLIMQVIVLASFPMIEAPAEVQSSFKIMSSVMMVFAALIAVALSVLFGWIIKRLLSASIVDEFRSR